MTPPETVFDSAPKLSRIWGRDAYDWYCEPTAVTQALLTVERFVGPVWDPACGQGNICQALRAAGHTVFGTDIADRGATLSEHGWQGTRDFLADDAWLLEAQNVCCNPPFYRAKGSEAFIRKALRHATGKVAVFADIKFLASGRRARGLYADHPPHRIWILADRPSCPPGAYLAAGNTAGGGTADWVWIVWDMTAPAATRPALGWLWNDGGQQ